VRTRIVAPALTLAALALAACGEQSPTEVAEIVDEATYECGEEGAGRIYDLILPAAREITREQSLTQERRAGCEPKARPETAIVMICEQADRAVVDARAVDDQDADVYVKTDDGWMLDPDTEPNEVCGPGAPNG